MTTLQEFPEEILLEIFKLFQLPFDVEQTLLPSKTQRPLENLLSIALCSKKFFRVVRPILYRTIYLRNIAERHYFIRSLCEHPGLGHYVRHLQMNEVPVTCKNVHPSAKVQKSFRVLKRGLELPLGIKQTISRGLANGLVSAEIALVLLLVPNLQELGLQLPVDSVAISKIFGMATQGTSSTQNQPVSYSDEAAAATRLFSTGHFSKLRVVRLLSSFQNFGNVNVPMLPRVLQLPNLQALYYRDLQWMGDPLQNISKVYKLTHLNLNVTEMRIKDLTHLISQSPQLRALTLTFNVGKHGESSMSRKVLQDLGNLLRKDALPHLEDLHISGNFRGVAGQDYHIGSLRGLKNLKSLRVSPVDLVGKRVHKIKKDSVHPMVSHDGLPLMDLHAALPTSLEYISFKVIRLRSSHETQYALHQVVNLMTKESRSSLCHLRVDSEMDGHIGWNRTRGRTWSLEGAGIGFPKISSLLKRAVGQDWLVKVNSIVDA
ncbi:hypothetical protein F5Y06DRAFT_307295 [Hypoxylon sp. FL0890]|nr:hypothetical protein F5Y06DRAFT_307295 [Hypoxylon sp. FL0890]